MKIHTSLVAGITALALWPAAAFAEVHVYSAIPLIGTAEVPPVENNSYGTFTGMYDDETNTFYYSFAWSLDSPATDAHFHGAADRDESADVLIGLGPVSGQTGMTRGSVTLSDAQESELLAGLWYINVHSENHPPGAIRGQLRELPPGETAAVYDPVAGELNLNTVTVPGLGVFQVNLERIQGRSPLSVQIGPVQRKDLDTPASEISGDSAGTTGDSDDSSGSDDDGDNAEPGTYDPYSN